MILLFIILVVLFLFALWMIIRLNPNRDEYKEVSYSVTYGYTPPPDSTQRVRYVESPTIVVEDYPVFVEPVIIEQSIVEYPTQVDCSQNDSLTGDNSYSDRSYSDNSGDFGGGGAGGDW